MRTRAGRVILGVVLTTTLIGGAGASVASAGSGGGAKKKPPLRIAVINQELGTVGTFPEAGVAMQAAADLINEEGGLDGHPLKLEICKTDATPESARRCAEKIIASEPDVFAPSVNFNLGPLYDQFQAANLPVMGGFPTIPTDYLAKDAFWFTSSGPNQFPAMARFIGEELEGKNGSAKTAGVLISGNASGRQALIFMQQPLEKQGVDVTVSEVADDATDYLGPFNALEPEEQDVLVPMVVAQGCIGFANSYRQAGVDTPVVTTTLCVDQQVIDAVGAKAVEGWYVGTPLEPITKVKPTPDVKVFLSAMRKFAGKKANTGGFAPAAFANLMTLHQSVLEPLGFDGITPDALRAKAKEPGDVFMGPEYLCGQDPLFASVCLSGAYIVQLRKGARQVLVRPEPFAAGDLAVKVG